MMNHELGITASHFDQLVLGYYIVNEISEIGQFIQGLCIPKVY